MLCCILYHENQKITRRMTEQHDNTEQRKEHLEEHQTVNHGIILYVHVQVESSAHPKSFGDSTLVPYQAKQNTSCGMCMYMWQMQAWAKRHHCSHDIVAVQTGWWYQTCQPSRCTWQFHLWAWASMTVSCHWLDWVQLQPTILHPTILQNTRAACTQCFAPCAIAQSDLGRAPRVEAPGRLDGLLAFMLQNLMGFPFLGTVDSWTFWMAGERAVFWGRYVIRYLGIACVSLYVTYIVVSLLVPFTESW